MALVESTPGREEPFLFLTEGKATIIDRSLADRYDFVQYPIKCGLSRGPNHEN